MTLPSSVILGRLRIAIRLCPESELENGNLGQYNSEHLVVSVLGDINPQMPRRPCMNCGTLGTI